MIDPCTIFPKECAAEKKAKDEEKKDEERQDNKKKIGAAFVVGGAGLATWGFYELMECVEKAGRVIGLPGVLWNPFVICWHEFLRVTAGSSLAALGGYQFVAPNKPKYCDPRNDKKSKNKKAKCTPLRA